MKRTKYRPAVVTLAILETHGRMGPTLKAFLAKIAPEDQQAGATWLQEAMRRISCAPSPNATDLTPCLPGSSWPIVPCSWLPCSATRVFSPGDFLRLIWSTWRGIPGALSTILDMTPASLMSLHDVVLWSLV